MNVDSSKLFLPVETGRKLDSIMAALITIDAGTRFPLLNESAHLTVNIPFLFLRTSSLKCIKLDVCISRVNYKGELIFLFVLLFSISPGFLQLSYKSMTYDFWLNPIAIWSLSLPLILFLFSPVPSHQNAVTKSIFLSLCWTAATTSSALRCCPVP